MLHLYVMRQVAFDFEPLSQLKTIANSGGYEEPVIPVSTYNIANRVIQSVSNVLCLKESKVHIEQRHRRI